MKKEYVLGMVFDSTCKKCLMLKRNKEPFANLYNGIGGKLNENELIQEAMLRELNEESGLCGQDIDKIGHLMSIEFTNQPKLNVFYIVLKENFTSNISYVIDEGSLEWLDIYEDNLLDSKNKKLAGDGNIPFFIMHFLNKVNKVG